ATVTAATWTASAGASPQARAMPKVKQMEGRMTELARRLATTYGRASTTTARAATIQKAGGRLAKVSRAISQRIVSAIAAPGTVISRVRHLSGRSFARGGRSGME